MKSILATQISFLFPGSIRGIKSSPCWLMSMLMTVVSAGSLQMEVVLFFLMNASSHRFYGIAQYPYGHQLCLSCKSVFPLWLLLPHPTPSKLKPFCLGVRRSFATAWSLGCVNTTVRYGDEQVE